MSRSNPRKAVAALLPLPIDCGGGAVVRPMTLGMWAALERIKSPLVTGKAPEDALELLPSLYLLTHDPREVLRGDLLEASVAWADALPVSALAAIRQACDRQCAAVFDVVPEAQKKTTGGTAWYHYAAGEYGWSHREIMWEVPLSAIALMTRRPGLAQNRIFPLTEVEKADDGDEEADDRG